MIGSCPADEDYVKGCETRYLRQLKNEYPTVRFKIMIWSLQRNSSTVQCLRASTVENNCASTWLEEERLDEQEYADSFSVSEISDAMLDGDIFAVDSCQVELDGTCCHGYTSPLILLESFDYESI